MSLSFEILPFEYWSPELKWKYALLANKEEGVEMFRTIDDLEDVGCDLFWYYAIVFSDGTWAVMENLEEAHEHAFDFFIDSSFSNPPSKAAEESGNSPPDIATLSRSEKTTTAGVMFSCICGENVYGTLLIENGIPTKIKCCNCGCLHHGSEKSFLVANFGTDCKHPVRTYDPHSHEFTCNECFQVIPGTLRAFGTNLPDGNVVLSVGDQVGSRPPLQEGE